MVRHAHHPEPVEGQNTNNKRLDKLTTLSKVEGQITMTKIQKSKPITHDR